ncbi:dephospho-CoA kinase [Candidatus Peregrinibacteria bacterium]|nr:dephospho-CoA kinase [Candidatus Peregrinibacteria bacterium]
MIKTKSKIIAVSGYLGSGKSTVLNILDKKGFDTVDADRIVHFLYERGRDGYRKINDFFGEEYILKSGKVNRKKLGRVVFTNTTKLQILEKLIHPLVYNEINKILDKNKSKFTFIEAVSLNEKKLISPVQYSIWIDVDKKTGYKRFCKKRRISYNEYEQIIKYQKKPDKIDFKIVNNGTKTALKKQVDNLLKKLSLCPNTKRS